MGGFGCIMEDGNMLYDGILNVLAPYFTSLIYK